MTESSFIQTIEKILGHAKDSKILYGIGDDAAVIQYTKEKHLLYTCDSLVSGVHFRREYMTPAQIGQKAVTVSVSDIAAMGGRPLYALISLHLPKTEKESFSGSVLKGIQKACKNYGIFVIGGNVTSSNQIIIDVFIIGEVDPSNILLRSGARPSDLVFTTQTLGDSAAGLFLLQNPHLSKIKGGRQLTSRHLSPVARVKEASLLSDLKCVTSMIDLSDGLSTDITHICDKSNTGVVLWEEKIPVSSAVKTLSLKINRSPFSFAFSGGEDYELCFTAPSQKSGLIKEALKKIGVKASVIGKILAQKEGKWIENKKGKKPLVAEGWDHYK